MNGSIRQAAEILRAGGLVAIPTETVYGLGADATNPAAVRKIFVAKGRPSTNPLIVHVADASVARRYATTWPDAAEELARRFWPGPLTIVLPKAGSIVADVSAGRDTVGLRVPDHPMASELLRAFDGPVAAPSANRSNRVSPTTAAHVREELGDAVNFVLDGGPCKVGIESTVIDLSRGGPIILRPGSITRKQIQDAIGPVDIFLGNADVQKGAKSPGQQAVHYSPVAPAFWFPAGEATRVLDWLVAHSKECATLLALRSDLSGVRVLGDRQRIVSMPDDPAEYARRLYAALRDADGPGASAIFVEMPPDVPEWAAVRDRLTRAAQLMV